MSPSPYWSVCHSYRNTRTESFRTAPFLKLHFIIWTYHNITFWMWTINIYSKKLFTCHTTHIVSHKVLCTVKHLLSVLCKLSCAVYVLCATWFAFRFIRSFISKMGYKWGTSQEPIKAKNIVVHISILSINCTNKKTEVKCRKIIERTRIYYNHKTLHET